MPTGTAPAQTVEAVAHQVRLVVPGALFALIVLVPIVVLLNTWRRNRAIERRYRTERGL